MKALLSCFVCSLLIANQLYAQIEPGAGSWKTWVIPSGQSHRLMPPPDARATALEQKELLDAQHQRDASAMRLINYWNAGSPGYRWQGVAERLYNYFPPAWGRGKALMNVAIYDATIAAWHSKYMYHRQRPSAQNKALMPALPNPDSPSYPCEHSVAAGAASAVLAYLFPAKADSIRQLAEQASRSRVMAGVVYPSDAKAGFELGQRVAQAVIERARTDGADAVWNGERPTGSGLWTDKRPPLTPMMGHCKPWVLTAGNQFRPGPPPDPASGMNELKQFRKTPQSLARAFYWVTNSFWDESMNQHLFESGQYLNPPRAARAYALFDVAGFDAQIACFDAKYTYWSIRPDQYDTTYVPTLLVTPPHPSYPSGHATISCARATVLGYLFPEDAAYFQERAEDAARSRFEGGVHFRVDNEVGLDMGRKVGAEIIKRARQDGADLPPELVRK